MLYNRGILAFIIMNTTELEPILQFVDSQYERNLENIPKNYSFGKEVYSDFIKRKIKIKDILNLDDVGARMTGIIKGDGEKKQYALETTVGFNKPLSANLLVIVNFLNDMTENPPKIFNNKYQVDFKEAVFLLKKNKISVEKVFSLKDEFHRTYRFSEYLFYDSKGIIRHHKWEDEVVSHKAIAVPKEEPIELISLNSALLDLNKRGLIGFDYSKIIELKEQYRKQFFSPAKKKNIAYYRKIIEEEQKIGHPLFSIMKETGFDEVINSLQENEILNYFPFSSRFDVEFLADVLRERFGGEK